MGVYTSSVNISFAEGMSPIKFPAVFYSFNMSYNLVGGCSTKEELENLYKEVMFTHFDNLPTLVNHEKSFVRILVQKRLEGISFPPPDQMKLIYK